MSPRKPKLCARKNRESRRENLKTLEPNRYPVFDAAQMCFFCVGSLLVLERARVHWLEETAPPASDCKYLENGTNSQFNLHNLSIEFPSVTQLSLYFGPALDFSCWNHLCHRKRRGIAWQKTLKKLFRTVHLCHHFSFHPWLISS